MLHSKSRFSIWFYGAFFDKCFWSSMNTNFFFQFPLRKQEAWKYVCSWKGHSSLPYEAPLFWRFAYLRKIVFLHMQGYIHIFSLEQLGESLLKLVLFEQLLRPKRYIFAGQWTWWEFHFPLIDREIVVVVFSNLIGETYRVRSIISIYRSVQIFHIDIKRAKHWSEWECYAFHDYLNHDSLSGRVNE